jgi:type II secretion system protein I
MNRRRGFSLIEVLVAMVIFSIGATSIIALFAAAAASHRRSVDQTRASMVAESLIAEVQARYGPESDPVEIEKDLVESLPASIEGYSWKVEVLRPGSEAAKKAAAKGPRVPYGSRRAVKSAIPSTTAKKDKEKEKTPAKSTASKSRKPAGKGAKIAAADPKAAKPKAIDRSEDADTAPADWSEEEVLVRVTVEWLQSGRPVTESFDTILLPRPQPIQRKAAKKG